MSPTPKQISAMEARGWTWQNPKPGDGMHFIVENGRLGLRMSVWYDENNRSGWHWWAHALRRDDPKALPSPELCADEAEARLRAVLSGFRFPWLEVRDA